jgi:signal transduction histidine kinase/predicted hydrocarbon binding protein
MPEGKSRRRTATSKHPRGAARLRTVRVPPAIEPLFLRAQEYVSRYFHDKVENPELGSITISGERYILLRAASMSVEFFDLVTSLYQDQGPAEAGRVARNLLFDLAHAIGKADAKAFQQRMGVSDPIERLSAGPIHFSFAGWAFVDISPESHPSPDDDFLLLYDHPYSFESDAWMRRGWRSTFPVCVMNSGYSSGWCEESFGIPLVATETECLAAGGEHCRFIMAPPSRIEAHLARLTADRPQARPGPTVSVPEFFQRKRMEDELRRSHELLEQRVAERTAELSRANERLRQEVAERRRAEAARDEFVSVAAHELKAPLTSLRGFAQLLLHQLEGNKLPDPERLAQALSAIDRQSEKLSRLVAQLLDVSRLESGQLVLDRQDTDVVALCAAVLEAARARAPRHTLSLRASHPVRAFLDPLRVEQVLSNLLDNAVKFSPVGGSVELEVTVEAPHLELSVTDHGIGIPAEHRERIFERYYQAHRQQRPGGMGLGLHISLQIVELHGGSLRAEHPAGGGTRLIARLPLAPAV